MSRRVFLGWVSLALFQATLAQAQIPFADDLLPTRTALGRIGLETHWKLVIPVSGDERLKMISMADTMLFAQTNVGNFHAIEAETGRLVWSTNLGRQAARLQPASVNSTSVFVTNLNTLYRLDRKTGRTIWSKSLPALSSTATSCDDNCVMVGLESGKVYAYGLNVLDSEKKRIDDRAVEIWNWQTSGPIHTRPIVTSKLAFFGSDDSRLYVSLTEERTFLYRILTGGKIGEGFATSGNRLIIVPSSDRKLYGIDIFAADVMWTYATGAPVTQAPLAAGNDIYVVNSIGEFSSLDPKTGEPKWTTSTPGGRLVAVGAKRVYLESQDEDLFIVDRETGKMIAGPRDTHLRAGLNLRPYDLGITNTINDRIYIGTYSGLIVALREQGEITPRPLANPKDLPFTFVPREGLPMDPRVVPNKSDEPVINPDTPPAEPPAEPSTDEPK